VLSRLVDTLLHNSPDFTVHGINGLFGSQMSGEMNAGIACSWKPIKSRTHYTVGRDWEIKAQAALLRSADLLHNLLYNKSTIEVMEYALKRSSDNLHIMDSSCLDSSTSR